MTTDVADWHSLVTACPETEQAGWVARDARAHAERLWSATGDEAAALRALRAEARALAAALGAAEPAVALRLREALDAHHDAVAECLAELGRGCAHSPREAEFRALVEASSQVVWRCTPEGRVFEINTPYPPEARGAMEDFGWMDAIHPEDRAQVVAGWAEANRQRKPARFEYRIHTPSHGLRWFSVHAVPILGADGEVREWLGTYTDIEERMQALQHMEGELNRRTQERNELWNFAQDLLVVSSMDLKHLAVNPAWEPLLGYSAEEVRQRGLWSLVQPEDRPAAKAALARLGQGRRVRNAELQMRARDGGIRCISWNLQPKGDHFLGVGRDVTAAWEARVELVKQAEMLERQRDELQAADRYKDEFLSVISHELRTPLNFIVGFGETLADELHGPLTPAQQQVLGKMLSGADRMLGLVNDLLDLAQMAAGKLPMTFAPHRVVPVVKEALAAIEPAAGAKQLLVAAHFEGQPVAVLDEARVAQVLANLLSNAVKFTEPGGSIRVRVRQAEERVRVEVADTGRGIAPAHVEKLFKKFSQLDMSSTRGIGGTGLGLAITKALVEAHGGTLGVESTLGVGATFWFELPLEPSHAPL